MNTTSVGSASAHIAFALTLAVFITLTVLGITNSEWLQERMPNWMVWLLFRLPVRFGIILIVVSWLLYVRNQRVKQKSAPTAEFFREPHLMMHIGYEVVPLLWEDGNRRDVNGFHQHIHGNTDHQDYDEGWHAVFQSAHVLMHRWMEENPEGVAEYEKIVYLQHLRGEIVGPDFTHWPLDSKPPGV